jgi:hypothetical protein
VPLSFGKSMLCIILLEYNAGAVVRGLEGGAFRQFDSGSKMGLKSFDGVLHISSMIFSA